MWIKLDDQTYAESGSPDPRQVIDIVELQNDIDSLNEQITQIESRRLEYPAEASADMRGAVDRWNEETIEPELLILRETLAEKQKIYNELSQL